MIYIAIAVLFFAVFIWYRMYTQKYFSVVLPDVLLQENTEGEISVVTYNIAGLPERISSAQTQRRLATNQIGVRLEQFDIVNVQEDFNYNTFLYSNNKHDYKTLTKGKVPFGDGLNTLSKFPILEYRRIPWLSCSGSDCLTPKGFCLIKIKLANHVVVDVYNVHANSGNSSRAAEARRHNLNQLSQYVHDHSLTNPLLIMGDFNAHYSFELDNISDFVKTNKLYDGWIHLQQKNVFPSVIADFLPLDKLMLNDEVESIDKILYRSSDNVEFNPIFYKLETELFEDDMGRPFSDHLAVSMKFKWTYHKVKD